MAMFPPADEQGMCARVGLHQLKGTGVIMYVWILQSQKDMEKLQLH